MPARFTVFIPTSSADSTQLTQEIKTRLVDRLANSKYRENFPIDVYVKEWNQGMTSICTSHCSRANVGYR
jgi:hypothetical protein